MKKLFFASCSWLFNLTLLAQSVSQQPALKAQFIQLTGSIELEYVEQGNPSGVPVIFLHGFTDSWHSFESTLPHLPISIHAFALTQRGHGQSFKPQGAYKTEHFAADVAAFIQAKQLGQAVIVGHSMGGVVAQQFALTYPHLTKALVFIDSDAYFMDNTGMPEFLKDVMLLSDPIDYAFADAFQKSTLARPIDSNYYKLLVGESQKVPAHVWKDAGQHTLNANFASQLTFIKKPVLIFWGDKDGIVFRKDQEALQKGIQGSNLKIYEEVGHALHWEQPERFAKDLTTFIEAL